MSDHSMRVRDSGRPVRRALFVSRRREKLIHSIIFFTEKTKYCNTVKLFKLLNFLDFEHYRQTGESVTGLSYKAWRQGPVPEQFWHELREPLPDLSRSVQIVTRRDELTDEPTRRDFTPRTAFNPRLYTKRELQILDRLAFFFAELTASQMTAYSHERGLPWAKVYREGKSEEIPYRLTLESTPVIPDMPTIDRDELAYVEAAFRQVSADTSD